MDKVEQKLSCQANQLDGQPEGAVDRLIKFNVVAHSTTQIQFVVMRPLFPNSICKAVRDRRKQKDFPPRYLTTELQCPISYCAETSLEKFNQNFEHLLAEPIFAAARTTNFLPLLSLAIFLRNITRTPAEIQSHGGPRVIPGDS